MPAPKAVKNNTCLSLKLMYLAISPPANEVPPANAHIATTRTMSIISILCICYVGCLLAQLYTSFLFRVSDEIAPLLEQMVIYKIPAASSSLIVFSPSLYSFLKKSTFSYCLTESINNVNPSLIGIMQKPRHAL
jgi:hypothetical protein